VANVALWAAGWEVRGQDPDVQGVVLFSAIMLLAAAFMWRGAYWAVLGFQALMAIGVLFAFLALLTASNLQAVALSLAFVLACGTMFWFLVRALARLQMPRRPSRQER
jgi:multisubunit Na+/H+ antiporter MnhB subunit